MARTLNQQAHSVKRSAILETARELVESRGYEQMAIQDILDTLQISKGAFYHYFDSKQALLGALIDSLVEGAAQILSPIVHDPQRPALEKLQLFFVNLARWKGAHQPMVLALLAAWYTDDNAIVRQKMRSAGTRRLVPLLGLIIQQGCDEDSMTVTYPEQAAGVIVTLGMGLQETIAEQLLSQPETATPFALEATIAAYSDALARVLGAPAAAFELFQSTLLEDWRTVMREQAAGR